MSQSPPLLVIVTGLPCTGKTVLAHRLAHDIHIPIIAKDDLKESLFDSLGWSDRDWSIKLGRATIQLLYQLVSVPKSVGDLACKQQTVLGNIRQRNLMDPDPRSH